MQNRWFFMIERQASKPQNPMAKAHYSKFPTVLARDIPLADLLRGVERLD
jgi:hypothetical protein